MQVELALFSSSFALVHSATSHDGSLPHSGGATQIFEVPTPRTPIRASLLRHPNQLLAQRSTLALHPSNFFSSLHIHNFSTAHEENRRQLDEHALLSNLTEAQPLG